MVTVDLQGGLGNQMFQVAAAYSLANDNNDIAIFDFNVHKIGLQGQNASVYIQNIFSNFINKSLTNIEFDNEYFETKFNYDKIEYKPNIKLNGYFQSEKYFLKYKYELIKLFKHFNGEKLNVLQSYLNCIKDFPAQELVSIHVRRGDYLRFPNIHTFPGVEYYKKAASLFKNTKFIIFSDDCKWVNNNLKELLNKNDNSTFVFSGLNQIDDYEEMLLMSLCSHNIIANSSFSWWGSYLNENENKIVVAPSKWFGNDFKQDFSDIFYSGMIKIDI